MIAALAAGCCRRSSATPAGILLAARARGTADLGRRAAAELVSPLVGLSLERSLALAEAMEARGYGGGPRTRDAAARPEPRRAVLLCGAAACAGRVADRRRRPLERYRYYDLLGDPVTAAAVGGSLLPAGAR